MQINIFERVSISKVYMFTRYTLPEKLGSQCFERNESDLVILSSAWIPQAGHPHELETYLWIEKKHAMNQTSFTSIISFP